MTLNSDAKFEEKTNLSFGKWHEEYGKFLTEPLKSLKIGIMSYASWQWRMMQNLKRNWLLTSKLTWGIWRTLTRALKSFKTLHFNGLLLTKACNVWAKKVQKSYVWWTENWWKIWRKTDLCFPKRHEGFGKFSQAEKYWFHFRN